MALGTLCVAEHPTTECWFCLAASLTTIPPLEVGSKVDDEAVINSKMIEEAVCKLPGEWHQSLLASNRGDLDGC